MGNFQYFGLFLDEETKKGLLDVFLTYLEEGNSIGYLMNKIYLDHCTLLHVSQLHGNSEIYNYLNDRIGEKYEIVINGIGISDKAVAFRVAKYSVVCVNEIPHITIATFNGGKPVDSNNIKEWIELDKPIMLMGIIKKV